MQLVKAGMLISAILISAVAWAQPSKPAVSSTAQKPPPAMMPCDRAQPNCSMSGQPMGPANRGPMTGGMHPGMMGPGNQGHPGYRGNMQPAAGSERIYGSQLMTPEERAAYRAKLRAAKTDAERARIRAQHHKEMQERAQKLGKTLPPAPPPA